MPVLRRLLVEVGRITACENGHVVSMEPTGEKRWVAACPRCEVFTWEDGNYCVWCGAKLQPSA
jgi:hypothetical protein